MSILFDFDGTLTKKSTIGKFYLECFRIRPTWKIIKCFPILASYLIKRTTFEEVMFFCAENLLEGLSMHDLKNAGNRVACEINQDGFWPKVLKVWREFDLENEDLIVVTGGFSFVIEAWLEMNGFNAKVFASELYIDERGFAKKPKKICVGKEKLVAFHHCNKEKNKAYGNSSGDYEMLFYSDEPFWVNKKGEICPWIKQDTKVNPR